MESFLSTMSGEPFQGTEDDPVGDFFGITHNCPFCGNTASKDRSLVWIAGECIASEKVVFPCNSCGEYITVPSTIFPRETLEKLRDSDLYDLDLDVAIGRMSPRELLVPNWGEVILVANKGRPVDRESLEWDGTGTCPGCGRAHPVDLSWSFKCLRCEAVNTVNQTSISQTRNTTVVCHRCGNGMIIPPTVWCPVCGRNLQDATVVSRLFREANGISS